MGAEQFPKPPNLFDPRVPGAVGSRESRFREKRNRRAEAAGIIADATRRLKEYRPAALPEEAKRQVHISASIEDRIYNYINQQYVNMANRYLVTAEDEFLKKLRDFTDGEEQKMLHRYRPKKVTELVEQLSEKRNFNRGEVDRSTVSMYSALHDHITGGIADLADQTARLFK